MDHIAIMKASWNLLPKIMNKEKTIESRWYKAKVAPWDRIKAGETIYFKDGGKPVTIKARVEKVLQWVDYTSEQLREIINTYGGKGKVCFRSPPKEVHAWALKRKYSILIFLKDPQQIEPFNIDKTGFGIGCAWMCVEDINKIKRNV